MYIYIYIYTHTHTYTYIYNKTLLNIKFIKITVNIEYSVVLIFVDFFSGIFDEQKLQKNSISEIFCKIINDFTVTFDTFNGLLLNKNITFFN